jgi:molybdenum-dependent DNA-binding transcriptional regulator ModE
MAGEFGRLRWSGAVREAFLRGLAAHGSVRRACRETGMSAPGAYWVRKHDPDFEKLWLKAVARAGEAQAARLAEAAAKVARRDGMFGDYRQRRDGWTPARTRMFLRALSETGCVRDACARANISNVSAYRMRKRDLAFARAWEKALDTAAPTLEQAAFERAVEGWDEIVWKDGIEVSRKRRYSDALLRFLLARGRPGQAAQGKSQGELVRIAHAAARAAGGIFATRVTSEETDAAIMKKLDMIDRARAQAAADAAAEAAAAEAFEDWEDEEGEEKALAPPRAAMPRITGG